MSVLVMPQRVPAPIAARESSVPDLIENLALLHQQWQLLNDQFGQHVGVLHRLLASSAPAPDDQAAHEPPLYATFFGGFTLHRGQTPLVLGHSKAIIELCRYLIARAGEMVARDALLELLWPDATPACTTHRLHVTVSRLRQILDPPQACTSYIQHEDDHYSIAAHAVVTDCHLFEIHMRAGKEQLYGNQFHQAAHAFQLALALYKGEYLADHVYAEWTHLPRAHYAEQHLNALVFLCEHAARENRHAEVIDYARQILMLDNLQERAHRWLMRVSYWTGQRACAVRHYRQYASMLQQELGVAPSHQTEALHAAICADAPLPDETPLFSYT